MKQRWRTTSVPRVTNRRRVLDYAAERGWSRIGGLEWNELRRAMPEVPLRWLRTAGLPVDQPWRGVIQDSFENLGQSLCELGEVYTEQPRLANLCREEVILAKDHARLASRNTRVARDKRGQKVEMVEWMLVWLGDPTVFPVWAALRMRQKTESAKIGDCSNI